MKNSGDISLPGTEHIISRNNEGIVKVNFCVCVQAFKNQFYIFLFEDMFLRDEDFRIDP